MERAQYSIPTHCVRKLGWAFMQLEDCKRRFNIEEYGFSQGTLESVFLHFAKMQETGANRGRMTPAALPHDAANMKYEHMQSNSMQSNSMQSNSMQSKPRLSMVSTNSLLSTSAATIEVKSSTSSKTKKGSVSSQSTPGSPV